MILQLRGAEVDLERRIARRPGQAPVELHVREADLLAWFLAHPVRPADRATLLAEVWGYRGRAHTRVVDVTVRRLREKIEADPSEPAHLLTVRGVGYRFEPPQAPPAAAALIGRDAAIAEIVAELDAGRTVTVCGLPGVGKSAVLDTIATLRPVVRIDAGAVRDADELLARLRAADRPDRVLAVDDLELAEPLARARATLRAPAVLVAALGPLGLPEERVVQLGPLAPADAAALYRRHARGPVDPAVAAELCAALDHWPLAIVLAAAQRPEVPEAVVLARARHAPLALSADLAALPERHRHLRRALAVGLAAVPPWERRALAQLTVFAGGRGCAATSTPRSPRPTTPSRPPGRPGISGWSRPRCTSSGCTTTCAGRWPTAAARWRRPNPPPGSRGTSRCGRGSGASSRCTTSTPAGPSSRGRWCSPPTPICGPSIRALRTAPSRTSSAACARSRRGNPEEARQRLEAADGWYAEAGNRLRRAWTQNNLGEVARRVGALDEAERHYRTARGLFAASGVDEVVADINLVLCAAAADRIDEVAPLVDDARRRAVVQGRAARIAVLDLARAVIAAPSAPGLAAEALAEAAARLTASGYVDPDVAALAERGRDRAASRDLQEAFAALAAAQRGA